MSITRAKQHSHLSTRTRAVLCYGLGRTRTPIFQVFFLRVPVDEMIFDALAVGLRCSLSLGGAQLITHWRGLWHRADKVLIISNKPVCQALSQPPMSWHTRGARTEGKEGGWLKSKSFLCLPGSERWSLGWLFGRRRSTHWTRSARWGLRAWEQLAGSTHPISLPLTQKLHGNCFLAAFPPPLWFIAARRLCVWRWHKSHQKERRKFAFTPLLAYWMQLSSSLLKSWAGLGQEGQTLALVLSMANAGLAALPEEAPMASNSHIQQLYLH